MYLSRSKLHITLLYESLCPDSSVFMPHLKKVHDELGEYIDLQLVPFGLASSKQKGAIFKCQHGPDECAGNRLQSCVISSTSNQKAQVKFVACQMFAPRITNADQVSRTRGSQNLLSQLTTHSRIGLLCPQCARDTGLLPDVNKCMSTAEGTRLQLEAELITKRYKTTFVPTIVYNHVFDQQLQDKSMHDFRGTVCYLLRQRSALPDNVCTKK
ncbi:hypothetical protein KR222_001412 [Zaprionus bogoriensis]|nr:hypothetical protein KR222_001412 [Zaprionus bogoriensis]